MSAGVSSRGPQCGAADAVAVVVVVLIPTVTYVVLAKKQRVFRPPASCFHLFRLATTRRHDSTIADKCVPCLLGDIYSINYRIDAKLVLNK